MQCTSSEAFSSDMPLGVEQARKNPKKWDGYDEILTANWAVSWNMSSRKSPRPLRVLPSFLPEATAPPRERQLRDRTKAESLAKRSPKQQSTAKAGAKRGGVAPHEEEAGKKRKLQFSEEAKQVSLLLWLFLLLTSIPTSLLSGKQSTTQRGENTKYYRHHHHHCSTFANNIATLLNVCICTPMRTISYLSSNLNDTIEYIEVEDWFSYLTGYPEKKWRSIVGNPTRNITLTQQHTIIRLQQQNIKCNTKNTITQEHNTQGKLSR